MRLRSLKQLDDGEGTVLLHAQQEDNRLTLHPPPNPNDPNDPLRWPRWKRHLCFGSVCSFVFLSTYGVGGLAPAFYKLSVEFDLTHTQTDALLIWPILTLGVFNFFWVPMATYFGKRPVFVFASLLTCVCYLWAALAQSFKSLLWSVIISSFAGSSNEALGAAIVSDLYFLHERGTFMSVYVYSTCTGNTIGPLICGFIITKLSWRWHIWIAFILSAISFVAILLFAPETRYDRSGVDNASPPSTGSIFDPSQEGKSASMPIEQTPTETLGQVNIHQEAYRSKEIAKKTWCQELSLWSGVPKNTNLIKLFLRPFPLLVYPPVLYAIIAFAVTFAWVVAIILNYSFVLTAPPYNFTPAIYGLINIAGLIGNLVGGIAGGWAIDRYSDWRSKKNKGVFQPETRLHLLFLPALIVPAGCLAFGYGVAESLNWTSIFFGYGMVAFGLTAIPVTTLTYISDCYLPVNEHAILLVAAFKSIVAFGCLYGLQPWVNKVGYVDSFGEQAGIYVLIMLLAIPLIIFGQRIRHATAQWRIIL